LGGGKIPEVEGGGTEKKNLRKSEGNLLEALHQEGIKDQLSDGGGGFQKKKKEKKDLGGGDKKCEEIRKDHQPEGSITGNKSKRDSFRGYRDKTPGKKSRPCLEGEKKKNEKIPSNVPLKPERGCQWTYVEGGGRLRGLSNSGGGGG